MHPADVERSLESMVCLVDSREQDTPRFRARIKQIRLPIERIAINAGDYGCKVLLPNGEWYQVPVVIERKMNIDELCMCYCQDRDRFEREFERAKNNNIRVYLLIEDARWENIYADKYRSRMRSKSLVASILSWLARYDCELIMCAPTVTGWLIHDILWYEAREHLLKVVAE